MTRDRLLLVRLSALAGSAVHRIMAANGSSWVNRSSPLTEGSLLYHVRWRRAGKKVLAHGSEEIDHLGILWKISFVLNSPWDHRNVAGFHCSLLVANAKIH